MSHKTAKYFNDLKISLKSLFRDIYFPILIYWFGTKVNKVESNTLLIIKTDAIGDYILFRNFLKEIRFSSRFRDYKITLLGNIRWQELCLYLDSSYVDNFIWLDRKKFLNNPTYTFQILHSICSKGFEIVFQPTYWREYYIDLITKVTSAREIIGSNGFVFYYTERQKKLASSFYTKIIENEEIAFEFYKNRNFIENFINVKSTIYSPKIELNETTIAPLNGDYIVFFPSASAYYKQWKPEHFAELIKLVHENFDWMIVLAGAPSDRAIFNIIHNLLNDDIKIVDFVGKTSLSQLLILLKHSQMLISNDTGAMHMAVALGNKTICIANGRHFGRFVPYPKEISKNLISLFPSEINNGYLSKEEIVEINQNDISPDINKILPGQVYSSIIKMHLNHN